MCELQKALSEALADPALNAVVTAAASGAATDLMEGARCGDPLA